MEERLRAYVLALKSRQGPLTVEEVTSALEEILDPRLQSPRKIASLSPRAFQYLNYAENQDHEDVVIGVTQQPHHGTFSVLGPHSPNTATFDEYLGDFSSLSTEEEVEESLAPERYF